MLIAFILSWSSINPIRWALIITSSDKLITSLLSTCFGGLLRRYCSPVQSSYCNEKYMRFWRTWSFMVVLNLLDCRCMIETFAPFLYPPSSLIDFLYIPFRVFFLISVLSSISIVGTCCQRFYCSYYWNIYTLSLLFAFYHTGSRVSDFRFHVPRGWFRNSKRSDKIVLSNRRIALWWASLHGIHSCDIWAVWFRCHFIFLFTVLSTHLRGTLTF